MSPNAAAPDRKTYSDAYQDPSYVERYEKDIYRKGSHDDIIWKVEQTYFEKLLNKFAPDHANSDALDFACGTGRILAFMVKQVKTLVGVDISAEMLARAKAKVPDVQLICTNILENSQIVPGDKDIVTSFRFLLLSEPKLHEACVKELVTKMRNDRSIMILNTHGNPFSFRALSTLRNKIFRPSARKLPSFSLGDMKRLAEKSGLKLVGVAGMGYLPPFLYRILPTGFCEFMERLLANKPILWRFGTHIFFVLKKA